MATKLFLIIQWVVPMSSVQCWLLFFLYKPNFSLQIFGQESVKLTCDTNFLIFEG